MKEFLDKYLDKFIAIVLIVLITVIINMVIDKLIDRTIRRKRKKNVTTLLMFIKRIKKLVLYGLMILLALGQFDTFHKFSVTLLSGLGIGSVVLGLAAQESLKDFFGSFALVVGDAFEVGDFIECPSQNLSGTVEDITMRHTIIRTITTKNKPISSIVNLLSLDKNENIRSMIELDSNEDKIKYLLFTTKNGLVKRTPIEEFNNIRKSGKISIILKENDELIAVRKTTGTDEVVIGAKNGRMVRFNETEIRSMGRGTSGVKGIDLTDSEVVSSEIINSGEEILIVTEKGYGKKTYLSIIGEHSDKYIDLRYDKNYHRGEEKEYLEYWAHNYWTGKNGAWEIKSLNITEVE